MKKYVVTLLLLAAVAGCATQRYGRQINLTDWEKKNLSCDQIDLEIAKNQEFLDDLERQRTDISGAHVMGFLGDFGLGNYNEGEAAKKSGLERKKQLNTLKSSKCV